MLVGVISALPTRFCQSFRSVISWSASFLSSPEIFFSSHRDFSSLCQPVHFWPFSRPSARTSTLGSMSPNDSATGSVRSQPTRERA